MALELGKVSAQINEMGRVLAKRAERHQRALPAALELLRLFSGQQEELRCVAESEVGRRLRCASPGGEPLDAVFAAPDMAEHATLIATDGSQVYPDRHSLAFYYVINVGGIVFRRGSGQAPYVATMPEMFYREEDLYPEGVPVSSESISVRRNLAELRVLSELSRKQLQAGEPCLALTDGPLLLWIERPAVPQNQQDRILADYLSYLDQLCDAGVAVGGFVSRPQSAEVIALLYLAHLEPSEREQLRSLADTEFRGFADRALFSYLGPGERSALFARGAAANDAFRMRRHEIHFFYLNTGTDLARVEIPEWVTGRPEMLDLVHAAVHDQCKINNGYPYILTRADEQAVILGEERELLETMIVQAMARHGLPWPELSRKAQQKQVARWRRRR